MSAIICKTTPTSAHLRVLDCVRSGDWNVSCVLDHTLSKASNDQRHVLATILGDLGHADYVKISTCLQAESKRDFSDGNALAESFVDTVYAPLKNSDSSPADGRSGSTPKQDDDVPTSTCTAHLTQ